LIARDEATTNGAGTAAGTDPAEHGKDDVDPRDRPPSEGSPPEGSGAEEASEPARPRRRRKLDPKELAAYKRVVEGLLFSSRDPVSASRLASVIRDLTTAEVRELVEKLREEYRRQKRGMMVEEVAGGFRLVTVPELVEEVRRLHRIRTEDRLSPAALETLAIIAYRQPIIRADIEVIRGVNCGGTLKWLLEKGLVRIHGRADVLGRPLLYGTTREFLEQFGINSIDDLPRVDEFRRKTDA